MDTISVRVPEAIEKELARLSDDMGLDEEKIILEAIKRYIEEYEDYKEALRRYRDEKDELLSSEELKNELGL